MCPRGCGSFSCGLSSGKEIALSPRTASSSLLSFQNHPRAVAVDRWRGPRCRGFADSGVPPGGLTWRRREPQAAQQRGKCSRGEACPLGLLEIGGGGARPGRCSAVSLALQHRHTSEILRVCFQTTTGKPVSQWSKSDYFFSYPVRMKVMFTL